MLNNYADGQQTAISIDVSFVIRKVQVFLKAQY